MISTLALLLVAVCMPIALAQTTNTCRACNCQFSNVQALSQVIDERINAAMMNQPRRFNNSTVKANYHSYTITKFMCLHHAVIGMFGISAGSTGVDLWNVTDLSTLFGGAGTDTIDSVSRTPSDVATNGTNNLIAYRPSFMDAHGSNLGALFFNMFGIFPCLEAAHRQASIHLPCFVTTAENDGFHQGRAFIQAADIGQDFAIFSDSGGSVRTLTYGLAIQDCPELDIHCLQIGVQAYVACFLPRQFCA